MISVSQLPVFAAAPNSLDKPLPLPAQAAVSPWQLSSPRDTITPPSPAPKSAAERALSRFEHSYAQLLSGIQIEQFDPRKIETYLRMAEKRTGIELSEKEKQRLKKIADSGRPELLKLLALELRVGIPRRAEKEALAALGELMLYRGDRKALAAYLADPHKDENVKAYVRNVLAMHRVEGWLSRLDTLKRRLGLVRGGV